MKGKALEGYWVVAVSLAERKNSSGAAGWSRPYWYLGSTCSIWCQGGYLTWRGIRVRRAYQPSGSPLRVVQWGQALLFQHFRSLLLSWVGYKDSGAAPKGEKRLSLQ